MSDRTLRRAQTLTPFGVGAVFDIVGESFVAEDTTRWYGRPHKIRAPRIAALFGVNELRTAPPAPESGGLAKGRISIVAPSCVSAASGPRNRQPP